MQATTSKTKVYILSGLFIIVLMVGLFFYFNNLVPVKKQIRSVDGQIKQQDDLLNSIVQPALAPVAANENTYLLQQEVPVKPLMDQLLLQFEKAEVLSDSLILTMEFTDGEVEQEETDEEEVQAIDPNPDAAQTEEPVETEEEPAAESETPSETVSETAPELLPEGVKKITAELTVQSKDYDSLLLFLKEVEKLKRITVIEGITFVGPDELIVSGEEPTPDQLTYELTIAAYYLPELVDYLNDLPKVDFPVPNGKKTPFIPEDEEENQE